MHICLLYTSCVIVCGVSHPVPGADMFLQKRRAASKGRCLSGGAFTTTTLSIRSVFGYLLCVLFLPVGNVSSSRQPSKELAANVILLRRSVPLVDSPKLKLEHPTEIQTIVWHLGRFFWFAKLFQSGTGRRFWTFVPLWTVHPYIAVSHEHSRFSLVRELPLCGSMWLKLALPHILWFVCWLYCLIFLCTFCSSCDNTGFSVRSAARKFKVFLPAGGAGGAERVFSPRAGGAGNFFWPVLQLCVTHFMHVRSIFLFLSPPFICVGHFLFYVASWQSFCMQYQI